MSKLFKKLPLSLGLSPPPTSIKYPAGTLSTYTKESRQSRFWRNSVDRLIKELDILHHDLMTKQRLETSSQ